MNATRGSGRRQAASGQGQGHRSFRLPLGVARCAAVACLLALCAGLTGCQYQRVDSRVVNHVYGTEPGARSAELGAGSAETAKPAAKTTAAKTAAKPTLDTAGPGRTASERPVVDVKLTVTQQKPVEVSPGRELSPARSVEGNTVPVSAIPGK